MSDLRPLYLGDMEDLLWDLSEAQCRGRPRSMRFRTGRRTAILEGWGLIREGKMKFRGKWMLTRKGFVLLEKILAE